MSSVKLSQNFEPPRDRPPFNHQNTQDRLREAQLRRPPMTSRIQKDRKSVFTEVGLAPEDGHATVHVFGDSAGRLDHQQQQQQRLSGLAPLDTDSATTRGRTTDDTHDKEKEESTRTTQTPEQRCSDDSGAAPSSETSASPQSPTAKTPWYVKLATGRRPRVRTASNAPPSPFQGLTTMTMIALAVAVMAPLYSRSSEDAAGIVDAGPIIRRVDSPTDVCARWAQQSK